MNNYNPSYTANSQVTPDKFNLHKICWQQQKSGTY